MNAQKLEVIELLRPVWERHRAGVLDRIALVESALKGSEHVTSQAGYLEAHKLHGLLGTYGLAEGSSLAAAAEELLLADDQEGPGWRELADRLADFRERLAQV